jgi:TldD protein
LSRLPRGRGSSMRISVCSIPRRGRSAGEDRRIAPHSRGHRSRGSAFGCCIAAPWGFAASSIISPRRNSTCSGPCRRNCQRVGPRSPSRRCIWRLSRCIAIVSSLPVAWIPFAVPSGRTNVVAADHHGCDSATPGASSRSQAGFWAQRDRKLFASTEGSHLEFTLAGGAGRVQRHGGSGRTVCPRVHLIARICAWGYELIRDTRLCPRRGAYRRTGPWEKVRGPGDRGRGDTIWCSIRSICR